MAKGNMLLGYSRGSVGDVTFYRSGGSQRQRARNRQPNNPRTARQMAQRSVFANAVKFFKQLNSGFFRFAYEDKKTNESDYNAFMRHNVENSGYIGAKASKIADFPALGLWQLSAGSLREITAPFPQPTEGAAMYFDLGVTLGNASTVGELTTQLITNDIWRVGDILTFVIYRATGANYLPTVDTDLNPRAYAGYGQFILNTSDTTPLSNIIADIGGISAFIQVVEGEGLSISATSAAWIDAWENNVLGFSVIHSRNTASGLKVSSSTMVYNKTAKVLSAMSDSGEYYNEVLADWQASAEAILQGAGAQSGNTLPFAKVGSYFLSNTGGETMTISSKSTPNVSVVDFDLGGGGATSVNGFVLYFGSDYNPGYDVSQIDHNKVRIEGFNAIYNAEGSEYSQLVTQISYNVTAMTSAPTSPIQVYYDDTLIMIVTIR